MFTICALYKFSRLDDFEKMQRPLRDFMDTLNVRGTLLLAREGINGTISGSDSAINKILDYLNADKRLRDLEYKFSYSETIPFKRLKVKLKEEIVTLGIADVDPTYSVGTYVQAKDWNELISDPEVVLIDTRNNYEFEIGSFKGAINLSPFFVNASTDGVVRPPSGLVMIEGSPPSKTATQEFVVPRSIPIILLMIYISYFFM